MFESLHPAALKTWFQRRPRVCLDAFRRDPWWYVGLVAVLIAAVAPFWMAAVLPFMDLPQHLAAIRVLHSLDEPAFGLQYYYELALGDTQYLLYYLSVDWLAYLMPLETANRLVLSLYAVAVPLSLGSYMTAFGRDRAVGLLAMPLVFNTALFMGFVNYVVAFPLLFWTLAQLKRLLDHFSKRRFVWVTCLTLLLFYSHAQIFVLYLLLAGITGLCAGRGFHPKYWWKSAMHLVLPLALMAVWIQRSAILAGDAAWQAGHGGRNVSPNQLRFEPLLDRFTAIPQQLISAYQSDWDERLLLGWLGLVGGLALFRQFAPESRELAEMGEVRATLRARTPELLCLITWLVYVFSPISYKWIWPISHRLIPMAALLTLPCLAWRTLRWRPAVLIAPAVLLSVATAQVHVTEARAFAQEAEGIESVLAHTEPGRRVMSLIFERHSEVLVQPAFLHFGQYYVVAKGGVATFSFVDFPQSPIRYRPLAAPPRLPNRWEWTPQRFRFDQHGTWYDYFLIRDGGETRPRDPFGRFHNQVRLVHRAGPWALYARNDAFP